MQDTNEILAAAKELGEVIHRSPTIQAYLDACLAVQEDTELANMETELQRRYEELVGRQRKGEALSPYETNAFYKLREKVVYHPLIEAREAALKAVKAELEQVGGAISSILTVDYTAVVNG